jgi:modulator of FtsH protease HflC
MMDQVTRRIGEQAAQEYGIAVSDCRLRRLNFPEEVRSAVFEQIRSERRKVAATTRAEGESQARIIRSAADVQRARLIAEAQAEAARLVGQGEAEAARIANAAQAADPAFYQFLKTLETYRTALDQKTTVVLSIESPFFKLLTQGVLDLQPGSRDRPARSAGAGETTAGGGR